ncbi:hypothetical protein CLV24_101173 [Pontibacter ummariensis]|uniref:Uncharacterized protein n=1 Tax=Pontibacter ummariensis TaxID=1610492 RepID=A0A239B5V5_9BACT|nr:hypothetical protein CLV24_101173 [Pontibacter ummariensis]SNS03246.1 hypothetical protein SAMN06296052_101173 [Pontibacter ummariensis]
MLWLVLLLITSAQAFAQEMPRQLSLVRSTPVSSPTVISQDRNGNVYVLDARQNLVRIDSLGRPTGTFSPPTRGRIGSVEAWDPMKVLLFYEGRQELLLLDRFLRPISSTNLFDLNYSGTAKVVSPAGNEGYWLFDETNQTLSKLDLRLRQLTVETPLNLVLGNEQFDVRQLREYQNNVYLLDYNSGVYVFDNLGNYKKKLPFKGVSYMGFQGNALYFVQDGQLKLYDLYTQEERSIVLPDQKSYLTVLANPTQLYLFAPKAMDVYKWEL